MELQFKFHKAFATNSAATSFTAKTPTTTEPTGDGVITANFAHAEPPWQYENILVMPFGTNGNDDTFDMQIWGWSELQVDGSANIWIPALICAYNVILGNLAATAIAADTFLADTLTLVSGSDAGGVTVDMGSDLGAAYAIVPIRGFRHIEFEFDLAGGQEATGCNALWRYLSEQD